MFTRSLVLSGLLAAACATLPVQASAQSSISAEEVARRVDMAGRQRMLSQRMAKAACLVAEEVDAASALDQMSRAYDLFSRSDVALREGSPELGLSPERSADVLEALGRIDGPWSLYRIIVMAGIDTASVGRTELEVLDRAGLEVLREMNAAVDVTARAYADKVDEVPLGLAITIDIAGRQRMLTQRAVKEACLMRAVADPSAQAERLNDTIEMFDLSLTALRFGFPNAGIVPPPSEAVTHKLTEVAQLWGPVKALLQRAASGATLGDDELAHIARQSEPLLRTMNEAVGLYGT